MADLTSRADVVWRYLPRRTVKHAIRSRPSAPVGHGAVALCGAAPDWFLPDSSTWRGTGTQDEHDIVARLRECRRCARLLAPIGSTS